MGGRQASALSPCSVGKRFEEVRDQLGLSRAELAHAGGYSAEQIRKVELGERMPGGELLAAVLDLGGDIAYILRGTSGIEERYEAVGKLPTAEEMHLATLREQIRVEARNYAKLRMDRRKKVLSEDEADLIETYRDLSRAQRAHVVEMVGEMRADGSIPPAKTAHPSSGSVTASGAGAMAAGRSQRVEISIGTRKQKK